MKIKEARQRAKEAWTRRRLYDVMLRDVYDYVLPMRDVTGLTDGGGQPEAAKRVDKIFDSTAVRAAFRFAGRLQTELTPLFQQIFSLEAGPLIEDGDEKNHLTKELQRIGELVHGVLNTGAFHNAAQEMYLDLYAGTGAMFLPAGDLNNPVNVQVVPIPEIALEEGPDGTIWGIFWKRKWTVEDIAATWPNGRFSEPLKRLMDGPTTKTSKIEVCQYTRFDPKDGHWRLLVWTDHCAAKEAPFHDERFRTNPWLTPRFFKIPGEPYGRGPAQLAMANIKTANKARELTLKAAAFQLMGIWTYRNDGAFNPSTVRFEPMAMWRVASNGGPLGPTINRLPVGDNFDISQIVIADEREQMKQSLFDDTLPPDTGAVRSATEIAERMRRLSQDLAGAYGRLTLEIVVPLVRRIIDVLEQIGMLETSLKIDQLLTQVRVVAPIAAGQQAVKVQAVVQWVDILNMQGGPGAANKVAKLELLGPDIGRWMGVEERHIRTEAETKALIAQDQKMAAEQHAAEVAKNTAPANDADPAQPYVNGGAV
jgi:hypothetical protein